MSTERLMPPPPPGLTTYSFEGIYPENDPAHPNGGSLRYIDENGVAQTKTKMWAGICFSFFSSSAPTNKISVVAC